MSKPCKNCKGTKSRSIRSAIYSILKLGSTTKKPVKKTEKKLVVLSGENNTPPSSSSSRPILPREFKLPHKHYKKVGRLQFPSGTLLNKESYDKYLKKEQ